MDYGTNNLRRRNKEIDKPFTKACLILLNIFFWGLIAHIFIDGYRPESPPAADLIAETRAKMEREATWAE